MRTAFGRPDVLGLLAALAAGLAWLGSAVAQPQLPAPVSPVASMPPPASPTPAALPPVTMPPVPAPPPARSLVFPDGGFPVSPAAPAAAQPQPGPGVQPAPRPPAADYAPPGAYPQDYQDAPGASLNYAPVRDLYPRMLQEAASTRFGVAPLSVDIYAPPGFTARDQQDGPGVPEFSPIPPPVPVTPEERLRFVVRGIVPGSFLVPGTNTSVRLRGFVRLTSMYDYNPIGTPDIFVTNSIPVPQQRGENWNMTARPSRFALETWTPTTINDWNVHTFIEGDFFNGPGQAAGGGGNPFRLRHAFVDFGYFRVGQQNTVFMDANTWPSLVDFQGPAGWVNQRRPGMRMTVPLADKLFWAGGIEQPFSDITTNGRGENVQDVPDFATHLRYESDLGHAQVSGLLRSIGYRPFGEAVTRRVGWGMSAAGVVHPWAALIGSNPIRKANPTGLERSRLIGQYTFGWGIGRYLLDTVGLGLDGQVDPVTGAFDLPYVAGWLVSYEHWLTERWMSSVTYSQVNAATNGFQPASTYTGSRYLAVNVWYIPVRNVSIGAEYLFGQRKNFNGQTGDANRMQLMFQYNF